MIYFRHPLFRLKNPSHSIEERRVKTRCGGTPAFTPSTRTPWKYSTGPPKKKKKKKKNIYIYIKRNGILLTICGCITIVSMYMK